MFALAYVFDFLAYKFARGCGRAFARAQIRFGSLHSFLAWHNSLLEKKSLPRIKKAAQPEVPR